MIVDSGKVENQTDYKRICANISQSDKGQWVKGNYPETRYFYQFIDSIATIKDWGIYLFGDSVDVVNDRHQLIYSLPLSQSQFIVPDAIAFCRQLDNTIADDQLRKPDRPQQLQNHNLILKKKNAN